MVTPERGGGLVAVGRIIGVHGIRGELKVESLTDFPERFNPGSQLLLVQPDGAARPVEILGARDHKGKILLVLEGITDRTAAEALRGWWLKIREDDLSPLPPGRYYDHDLLGLTVTTVEGEVLGRIVELMPTGGNVVLAVRDGGNEILIPFIDDVVLEVDIAGGTMTVSLLDGLRSS